MKIGMLRILHVRTNEMYCGTAYYLRNKELSFPGLKFYQRGG